MVLISLWNPMHHLVLLNSCVFLLLGRLSRRPTAAVRSFQTIVCSVYPGHRRSSQRGLCLTLQTHEHVHPVDSSLGVGDFSCAHPGIIHVYPVSFTIDCVVVCCVCILFQCHFAFHLCSSLLLCCVYCCVFMCVCMCYSCLFVSLFKTIFGYSVILSVSVFGLICAVYIDVQYLFLLFFFQFIVSIVCFCVLVYEQRHYMCTQKHKHCYVVMYSKY